MHKNRSVAIVIPAYRPGAELLRLVAELSETFEHMVVVDDGSGPEYREVFDGLARFPAVALCRHAVNLGKGAALKTGMNAALCTVPSLTHVITADADGQHHTDDIGRIADRAEEQTGALILGARSFSSQVPWRSRLGNQLTRSVMRIVAGQNLADTQTGLRAVPANLIPALLRVPSLGYEFELDMLLQAREERVAIIAISIRTIYVEGNAASHFNPIADSTRIYFVLLRFALASVAAAAVDNLVFAGAFFSTGNLVQSQIFGRVISMTFNYVTVRRFVFRSRDSQGRSLLLYLLLVAVSGTLSYGLIRLLTAYAGFAVIPAKILAESILFAFNFLMQRDVIFVRRVRRGE